MKTIIKSEDLINYTILERAHYNKTSSDRIMKFIIEHNLQNNFNYYQDKYIENYKQYIFIRQEFVKLNNLEQVNWSIDFDKKEMIISEE